jgi:hypothetical protein
MYQKGLMLTMLTQYVYVMWTYYMIIFLGSWFVDLLLEVECPILKGTNSVLLILQSGNQPGMPPNAQPGGPHSQMPQ